MANHLSSLLGCLSI